MSIKLKGKRNELLGYNIEIRNENRIIIDRPKGTHHPKFEKVIYPLDYGYLSDTTAVDGSGIDIFIGSHNENIVRGIICTVDEMKKDAEIKIMYRCTDDEVNIALEFLNKGFMRSMFVKNPM